LTVLIILTVIIILTVLILFISQLTNLSE
jgi:hypothetical protein